jgi:hypothetical protein
MGVVFARLDEDDKVLGLAKNSDRDLETEEDGSSLVSEEEATQEKEPQE